MRVIKSTDLDNKVTKEFLKRELEKRKEAIKTQKIIKK
jgi:hypothetical protein|tara:strand:+ start:26 stop:139 length:114 start_codon:yes stop_codon:yes gene_type:complete